MKTITLAMLGIGLMVFSGCASPKSAFVPPIGGLYTNYKAPLLTTYDDASVSGNSGDASAEYIHVPLLLGGLFEFAFGDCSLDAAVSDGRFTHVGAADYEFFSVLGVYARTTVHVYEAPAVVK
ncbi:MAG: TRL domain-containing protein [Kiritimatiellales bacterium]